MLDFRSFLFTMIITDFGLYFLAGIILAFIVLSGAAAASPFTVAATGTPQMNLTTNRLVILDDPSGWDGGAAGITDRGDQWQGESTTIRWYALLINSSGRAARNITVTSQLLFPNGTVVLEKTNITNSFGIAAFDQDMNRWLRFNGSGSEGVYTINTSATVDGTPVAGNYNFIYDEWGCGSSGSGCHASQYWQGGFGSKNASTFAAGSIQNSPYLHAWDNFHNATSHGLGGGFIGNGECLTCHRGYDGIYRNHSSRVQAASQYPSGVHSGKVPCTGCHAAFNSGTMPILRCYNCHPMKNNNLTVKTFSQTASSGFSYQPLTDTNITAHNAGMNIPCIMCHNGMHNVSKPYNAIETSNSFTEYQQCTACHTARKKHNDSVSCTVCHSQDAHAIKVFAQNATYIQGSENANRGNCTNCHQNSSFLSALLSQPKAGALTGSAPQVSNPLNHSNDALAGMKWNATSGYWMNGTDGSAQLSSCKYCHGDTLHKTAALGRPSLWEGNNTVNSTIDGTSWCASCHWQGYASGANTYNDTVSTFTGDNLSVPPEITGNATYGANRSAPAYFDHSDITMDDAACKGCHGILATGAGITGFMHNVATGSASGGGTDCALCHDINGIAPKRINFSAFKVGVHENLNSNATNNTMLSEIADKACWACHGEGNEPAGHPLRYRNPRRCSNNDCHSLSQSFRAPMVYSHFKDAALNGNPENTTNFNISTKVPCESCHSNSLTEAGENLNASVSHYATTGNLIGSMNCIYCHLDKDNSEKWGNATEINKNRTSMIELDKLNNKFTAREGEFVELGIGYRIKVTGISTKRGSANMELYKADALVDKGLVNTGKYIYEEYRMVDNATTRIPVLILNITGMFVSDNESFIQFDGTRIKRLHYENKTTSCYQCHFSGDAVRRKYTVIDRIDDKLFYTEVFFNSSDKNEFYQEQALRLLTNMTPADAHSDIERSKRMTLREGGKWELAGNYSFTLEGIDNKSASARFLLQAGGNDSNYTEIVERGNMFVYEPDMELGIERKNITLFRAKVAEIQAGTPGVVVLEDILALSPEIKEIEEINDNTTISGYNTSWLWENDTFLTGRIPTNLHVPLLQQGRGGGPDCVSCHNVGELGAHTGINPEAPGSVAAINKACWACHGTGKEPERHPANYRSPRECKSCHVEQQTPFFNATYIGDEKHGSQENCRSCHIENTHKLLRFDVVPTIKDLSLSKKEVVPGENITIKATIMAGYLMKVRAAEYYIDSSARAFPMAATDGSFDDQTEEITATLDTSGLAPGDHTIYVRAMERNNKWGPEEAVTFVVQGTGGESRAALLPVLAVSLFLAVVIFRMRRG